MENDQKTNKNKFHLTKYYLHDESNDIKYRGPLSYRHLRIAGWVCMVFMALSILFSAFAKLKHSDGLATTSNVFNTIGTIAIPLFLIANFGFILRHHNKLKKILLFHGLTALGMIAVAYLFVFRYAFSMLTHYNPENYSKAELAIDTIINANPSRYVFLNVFIDLFLCSASFAILTYKPKKFFTGKKIILFRLLIIFPIIYEVGCVYLKLHVLTNEEFFIPWYIFPLLTTKPPFFLTAFLILTVIFAIRKHVYLKHGHSSMEYERFLKTNANSLHFSIITAIIFLVVIILDILTCALVTDSISTAIGQEFEDVLPMVSHTGLGMTYSSIILLPVIILFSYSKEYNDKIYDKLIPVAGIGLCVYAVLESFVQLFSTL